MSNFADRYPRYDVLGTKVHAVSSRDLIELIDEAIRTKTQLVISHQNLHSAYIGLRDARIREYSERADVIYPDGMSIVVAAMLAGLPFKRCHRSTPVDWIWPMMEQAQREHHRVYFMGAKPGVAEAGAERLRRTFPGLLIDTHHGYFDKRRDGVENDVVIERIRAFDTDILIVGFGSPLQEHWIADNLEHIPSTVVFASGAIMDYLAGAIPTPPRWMGHWGLEWLARLVAEPRRLWRRYIVEPWFLALPFARDIVRYRIRR